MSSGDPDRTAIVESTNVGRGTRIHAFAHVCRGAVIGEGCEICDHAWVGDGALIGNRVSISVGAQIWPGVVISDDVRVGANATISADAAVASGSTGQPRPTLIQEGATIGANATVLAGTVIGANAMVSAGAVVTRSIPIGAIVAGNPAQITDYLAAGGGRGGVCSRATAEQMQSSIVDVVGVKVHEMPLVTDLRGSLSYGQCGQHLPFVPKRYFLVFHVPGAYIRGEHAHRTLHQFLVCVNGSCTVAVDDGRHRGEVQLTGPQLGLHIGPMVWATQHNFTADAVLLVLASDVYSAEDYIRDYHAFIRESGGHGDDRIP